MPSPAPAARRPSSTGHAHDHNFAFLTAGYLGPGFWSDHYEPVGYAGERIDLRPLGRARLSSGEVWLYRAHRDVHVQHPPDAFSVSLNIILAVDPGQPWRTQFRYDIAAGMIAEVLTTSSEALVAPNHAGRGVSQDAL